MRMIPACIYPDSSQSSLVDWMHMHASNGIIYVSPAMAIAICTIVRGVSADQDFAKQPHKDESPHKSKLAAL